MWSKLNDIASPQKDTNEKQKIPQLKQDLKTTPYMGYCKYSTYDLTTFLGAPEATHKNHALT